MTHQERRGQEKILDSMNARAQAVRLELRQNWRMSPEMKAQLQQEEAALKRQRSALSRRLADAAASDVLAATERDRTTRLEEWADSMGGAAVGRVATCAVELPSGGASEWVMLMPAGELNARDGRRWRLDDADKVIAETRRRNGGVDMVFDYEHQTQHAERNGQEAPAAGWIKELRARAGAIWARVEWTAHARERIKAREYRYVSPVFRHTRAGVVTAIEHAALTNNPALDLPALAKAHAG